VKTAGNANSQVSAPDPKVEASAETGEKPEAKKMLVE
jgi:hypothetical protein